MKVTFPDGRTYLVSWHHENRVSIGDGKLESGITRPYTECLIYIVNGDHTKTLLNKVSAYLHPKDQYNKNVGRKISMQKALKDFSYNDQTAFWSAYKEMRNGKY